MKLHTGPRIIAAVLVVSLLCMAAVYALSLTVRDETGAIDPKASVLEPGH
ncbi:hypothetical protein ACLE20_14280 [Rhizobium sp. YIM 134829]